MAINRLRARSWPGRRRTCRPCRCRRGCRSRACRPPLGVADVDPRAEARERGGAGHDDAPGEGEAVVARGARDRDAVRLAVAAGGAERVGEAHVDELHRRAGQVVDRDRVGAAAGERVDLLEVAQLERDAVGVAREPHAPAGRLHAERLGRVGAAEEQRVAARAAVDAVAPVAGRPAEAVEVAAEPGHVVAAAAGDVVELGAAEQHVVAGPAAHDVGAVAAVERERHPGRRRAEDVVAAAAFDGQLIRRLGALELHERRAEHGHAAERADRDLLVLVGAANGRPVARAVAGAQVDVDLEHVGRGEVVDGHAGRAVEPAGAHDVDPVELERLGVARQPCPVAGGRRAEPLAGAAVGERVEALAQVHADAVEAAAVDVEVDRAVVAEVDVHTPGTRAQPDGVVIGAAGDEQGPLLDPDGRRALDEVALAVARLRAAQVAADLLGERAGQLGVGEIGDQEQPLVERHRSAEQPLARRRIREQAVAQRLGGDAGDLELDRVDLVVAARQVVEREHRLLLEATRGCRPRSRAARPRRRDRRRTPASARTSSCRGRRRRRRRRGAASRAASRRPARRSARPHARTP